jgi:hypothetical protein
VGPQSSGGSRPGVLKTSAKTLKVDHTETSHEYFQRLKPGRQVWRLPYDCLLLSRTRSNQVANHNHPGRDADAGLERSTRLERGHRRDEFQTRAYRPLSIILMGLRVTEIHQHAVNLYFATNLPNRWTVSATHF